MYMFPQPVEIKEDGSILSTLYKGDKIDAIYNKFGINDFAQFVNLITQGSIVQAHLMTQQYNNILFVTTYRDSTLQGGVDDYYSVNNSAGFHMAPLVHTATQSAGRVYATTRKGSPSKVQALYKKFGINMINSNSTYMFDTDNFYLQNPSGNAITSSSLTLKFDCVVLLGQTVLNEQNRRKYSAASVKEDFARYCTPGFDLIALAPDGNHLIAGKGNTTKVKEMNERVATLIAPGPSNGITWKLKNALSAYGFQNTQATRALGGKRTRSEEVHISRYEYAYNNFVRNNQMRIY